MKIYVPYENVNEFACYSVQDGNTIRAYSSVPSYNSSSNYTDFFINSHYITKTGTQSFGQYTNLPTCLNTNNLSNNVFYRNDIFDILGSTFIILIICFYFPYRIISRLFGRWLKL